MVQARFLDIFNESKRDDRNTTRKDVLEQFIDDQYFSAKVAGVNLGTAVTRYDLDVKPKYISYFLRLNKEFNAFFDTNDCRLMQDGKYVTIEVPNRYRGEYCFRDCVKALQKVTDHDNKLWVAIGEGLDGKCIIYNLVDMPHLLVAGQTGSGKSVFLHNIILSLLVQYTKEELNFVLIDPKKVEFDFYRNAPQVREVVTTTDRAVRTIRDLCDEMENRYECFAEKQARDISSYNQKSAVKMPRIVVIIEELADLVLSTNNNILDDITRLVVKARACGIHVVLATQRPEAELLGGKLRSNFQCRVAFSTASGIDSRVVLGRYGAEKLKGKGDGIFRSNNGQKNTRFQSAMITEEEIKNSVKLLSDGIKEE